MVLIGAACGAGVALGLLLIVLGVRGVPHDHQARIMVRGPVQRPSWLPQATAGVLAAVALYALTGWPVGAALAGTAAAVVPPTLRKARAERALADRTEAVAVWTEMLRDTLAAAAGLEEAVKATTTAAPEPIRPEVRRLAERVTRRVKPMKLATALELFAEELENPAADLVVAALVLATQREARDLVPLLTALSRSARAEAEMRLRVQVSRARIHTTVRVVVTTLALFAGGLILFNRSYLEPYGTATGQIVLLFVGGLIATGWLLIQRMARIAPPERFLVREPDRLAETGRA